MKLKFKNFKLRFFVVTVTMKNWLLFDVVVKYIWVECTLYISVSVIDNEYDEESSVVATTKYRNFQTFVLFWVLLIDRIKLTTKFF